VAQVDQDLTDRAALLLLDLKGLMDLLASDRADLDQDSAKALPLQLANVDLVRH
jgi:hypothetical protein